MPSPKKPTKTWDIAALLDKTPVVETVDLVIDPEWGAAHEQAVNDLELARRRSESSARGIANTTAVADAEHDVSVAEKQLAALEKTRGDAVVRFEFAGLNGYEYDRLIRCHQPTAKQRGEMNKTGDRAMWNAETFPPALVDACMISPKLSEDDVGELFKSPMWNAAETGMLFSTALLACTRSYRADT